MRRQVLGISLLLWPLLAGACTPPAAGRGADDKSGSGGAAGSEAPGGAGGGGGRSASTPSGSAPDAAVAGGEGGASGSGGSRGAGGAGGGASSPDMGAGGAGGAMAMRNDAAPPATPPADAGAPGGDAPPAVRITLPFAVDDLFVASGYMGDGEVMGGITDMPCAMRAAATAPGVCHGLTWTPGAKGWAGVWWQYPLNNWGMQPGAAIAAGAKEIRFWAWGATGTEKVSFFTGYKMTDGFNVEMKDIVLKTTPTAYTLSLTGKTYDRVAGGFGWVAGNSMAPVKFNIDGIEWR